MTKLQKGVEIIKADGTRQIFSERKLMRSLRRSGASVNVAKNIATQITREITVGMHTRDIYRRAFRLLRRGETKQIACRYNLRNAIMELGPDGFAFEKFIGEIFKKLGYKTRVGVMIRGWCIDHEVDVSAKKDDTHILVECKFHNRAGIKTDLKVALYVKERFDDIEKKYKSDNRSGNHYYNGWLVTNTKLTTKAIQYSKCAGLYVVGWGYPRKGNLEDLILETKIHPVTALTTLSMQQKRQLLERKVVVCRDIHNNSDVLRQIGVPEKRINTVLREVEEIRELRR